MEPCRPPRPSRPPVTSTCLIPERPPTTSWRRSTRRWPAGSVDAFPPDRRSRSTGRGRPSPRVAMCWWPRPPAPARRSRGSSWPSTPPTGQRRRDVRPKGSRDPVSSTSHLCGPWPPTCTRTFRSRWPASNRRPSASGLPRPPSGWPCAPATRRRPNGRPCAVIRPTCSSPPPSRCTSFSPRPHPARCCEACTRSSSTRSTPWPATSADRTSPFPSSA